MGYIARISGGLTAFACAGFLIGAILNDNGSAPIVQNQEPLIISDADLNSGTDRIDNIITSAIDRVKEIDGGNEIALAAPKPKKGEVPGNGLVRKVKTISITPETVGGAKKFEKPAKKAAVKAPAKEIKVEPVKKAEPAGSKFYTVKPGDNLYRIGLNHGLSLSKIAGMNGIKKPYTVHVGQKIAVR